MNIEDQLDAQRELYKRQYQDLSERFSALEAFVNDVSSLIESRSSESNLTEVTAGFFLDLSCIQQLSIHKSQSTVNWQLVSNETALSVLTALDKQTTANSDLK
jgi:hypothetical protein